ncbi:neuronal acetylcholine receptor subunit alpha-7-like [Macrobrachium nipponense]|uniref:neuronal acetylcholine receptor subunit alpha-7-like n=1 Tax=Macrobrachium nipponense TaxID=159736 RepID=UPI0030C7DEA6
MYLLLLLMLIFQEANGISTSDAARQLKKKLTDGYYEDTLPSEQMKVEINTFSILDFTMNERDHSVEIYAAVGMSWTDPKLTWNPSEHSGINKLGYKPWKVWSPDFAVENVNRRYDKFLWSYDPIQVTSDGKVTYTPVEFYRYTCLFDMTYWPHDTHNCSLVIKSWNHGKENLDFDIKVTPTIDLTTRSTATGENIKDWDISNVQVTKTTSKYPCCTDPFTDLRFSMIFTRRGPAFTWTVKVPVVCLVLLTMGIFLLPPDAGEKFMLGGFIFFIAGLFLATTVQIISASPSHTPLLVQMAAQQLLLSALSMLLTIGVFRISKTPHSTGIPAFLKGPTLGLSRLLLLGNYTDLVSSSHKSFTWTLQGDQVELADDSPAAIRERERCEWVLLGALIDRLLFILYMAIALISFIRFSSVL